MACVTRLEQAATLQHVQALAAAHVSQRQQAEQRAIPRSTLHAAARPGGQGVATQRFFHSPEGVELLHRLVTAGVAGALAVGVGVAEAVGVVVVVAPTGDAPFWIGAALAVAEGVVAGEGDRAEGAGLAPNQAAGGVGAGGAVTVGVGGGDLAEPVADGVGLPPIFVQEGGEEALQHVEVGLVAQDGLGGPVETHQPGFWGGRGEL